MRTEIRSASGRVIGFAIDDPLLDKDPLEFFAAKLAAMEGQELPSAMIAPPAALNALRGDPRPAAMPIQLNRKARRKAAKKGTRK